MSSRDTSCRSPAIGAPPSGYVASFLPVFERAIDRAVEAFREGTNSENIGDELYTTVRAAMVDMQVGVDEFVAAEAIEPITDEEYDDDGKRNTAERRVGGRRRSVAIVFNPGERVIDNEQ